VLLLYFLERSKLVGVLVGVQLKGLLMDAVERVLA
jgi:hypothetical protein